MYFFEKKPFFFFFFNFPILTIQAYIAQKLMFHMRYIQAIHSQDSAGRVVIINEALSDLFATQIWGWTQPIRWKRQPITPSTFQ